MTTKKYHIKKERPHWSITPKSSVHDVENFVVQVEALLEQLEDFIEFRKASKEDFIEFRNSGSREITLSDYFPFEEGDVLACGFFTSKKRINK